MAETFDDRNKKGVTSGRAKVSEQKRQNSFSKRALQGKIQFIEKKCPYCHHHKLKRNESPNSPFYDRVVCTKCKKEVV